jgi:DNA-binding response OmpR family regulator
VPGELILIVDDEPYIVQLPRMYLEREGFRVESVGDGLAALEAVRRHKPALLVLDLMSLATTPIQNGAHREAFLW